MAIHATKLHQPRPRANWVMRERLLALLDRGLESHPLTLVSGPAGAGKTTLLAHWLAARPCRAAWLSLDSEDDNPVRFWSCVIQALQCAVPGLGQAVLDALNGPIPPPLASLLPALLNEIGTLIDPGDRPLVLVLDDYHVLNAHPIHESIAEAVDHMPDMLRVVVCTRADPPLPLARWRARDMLTEVREADLRFSPAEALVFLNQRMDLRLHIEDAERLVEQTEGWAAGLQLAALSLQGQVNPEIAIQSLAASKRFVLEYLLEEVLARQPEATLLFLLRTSILERLCGPLCEAVSGQRDGADTLAALQRQNLFVIPLDDEHCWYRYHHLFAELLRARLQQTAPDEVKTLHVAASDWYAANGSLADAVRHALAAQDPARAAHLIEAREHDWWTSTDVTIIGTGLIARLPDEVVARSPNLMVYRGWGLLTRGQLQESERLFAQVERTLSQAGQGAENPGLLAFASLQLAHIAELTGREPTPEVDARLLAHIPEVRGGLRNSAEVVLAYLLYRNGNFSEAAHWLQETINRDMRTGATNGIPIAASRLARMLILQGRLYEAEELCRRCRTVVEERGKWRFYVAGNLSIVLGDVLREWNRLDEAEAAIRCGLQDNEPWAIPHAYITGYSALARLLLAKDDSAGASAALARQQALSTGRTTAMDLESETRAAHLRVSLATSNMDEVVRFAGEWARIEERAPSFRNEQDALSLARAWLAMGHYTRAARLLEQIQRDAAEGARLRRTVEILVLLAEAYHRSGEHGAAGQALEQAIVLAAPMGAIQVFLDEGAEMAALVRATCARPGLSPEADRFARRILTASPVQASVQPGSSAIEALVEPLTQREREVLALIAAGLSNQDIAERLVITVAAVKKHTGNIYGKLGVTSRTQAVVRAQELGLRSR